MKHTFLFTIIALRTLCNADSVIVAEPDSVTIVTSQQSWTTITSDNNTNVGSQSNAARTVHAANPVTFSTQHKTFRHHTAAPHYDLRKMSPKQLAQYFSTHGYTEEKILKRKDLFESAAFVALAKQLPKYSEYIHKYYNEYRNFNWYTKFIGRIFCFYAPGFQDIFTRLYEEDKAEKYAQENREQRARAEHAQKIKATDIYIAKIASVATAEENSAIPYHHQKARNRALAQLEATTLSSTKQKYGITHDTITFAHEYGITEHDLTTLRGNAYEHQLHIEFLDQLANARTISTYYALQPKNILIHAVCHGVAIGMEANRLQQPDAATVWANFGWKTLEVIKGMGEGLLLCVENTARCIQDPKHAVTEFAQALGTITGYCARAIGTVAHWHELMEQGNGLLMAQEMDDIATKVTLCGTLYADKLSTMSARDIAKNVTYVAADIAITHKMFILGSQLCSELKPIVFDIIENIRQEKAFVEFALQGVEELGDTQKMSLLMEEIEATSTKNINTLMQLSASSADTSWVSKEGLIYGPDKKFGTRINHILQHTKPNTSKLNHTVFTIAGDELFDLIDFAWSKRGVALADDPGTYIVELEKIIGTQGEKAIKIVVIPGTTQVITAYPVKV